MVEENILGFVPTSVSEQHLARVFYGQPITREMGLCYPVPKFTLKEIFAGCD
jgi:hypothetical protein